MNCERHDEPNCKYELCVLRQENARLQDALLDKQDKRCDALAQLQAENARLREAVRVKDEALRNIKTELHGAKCSCWRSDIDKNNHSTCGRCRAIAFITAALSTPVAASEAGPTPQKPLCANCAYDESEHGHPVFYCKEFVPRTPAPQKPEGERCICDEMCGQLETCNADCRYCAPAYPKQPEGER